MAISSKSIITSVCILAIGIGIGIITTADYIHNHTLVQTDTVYIYKTIEIDVADAHRELLPSMGSVSIPSGDITSQQDSSVSLVRKDSVLITGFEPVSGASYEAVVSGVRPNLDRLKIIVPERVETRIVTKPPSGWSFGVFAGCLYRPRQFDARTGLYVSYTAGPFCVYADAGAMWSDIGPTRIVSPYIGVGLRLQLYHNK